MHKIASFIFFLIFLFFGFLAISNFENFKTEFDIIHLTSPKIEPFKDDKSLEDLREQYLVEEEKKEEEIVVKIGNSNFEGKEIKQEEIIRLTNLERTKKGLNILLENQKLNKIAEIKAADMFFREYFAHMAPTGEGVSDLANKVFYSYIFVGENLAKGNFRSTDDLLTGWMNSPAHRDNILKGEYTEMGAAAIEGSYKGNQIWMAVQIFGTPSKICPNPNQDLLAEINKYQESLELMKKEIDELEVEISKTKPARGKEYMDKVNQYNNLVEEYNLLREFTSKLISVYNDQIYERNSCLKNL